MRPTAALALITLAFGLSSEPNMRAKVAENKGDQHGGASAITLINDNVSSPDTNHAQDRLPRWYASPEWWLVILGFPTLAFIGWQALQTKHAAEQTAIAARATERSAAATENSAAATAANTQAFRDAERAWIVEEIRFPDHIPRLSESGFGGILMVAFVAKNIGKQPAFVRMVQSRFCAIQGQLPDQPQYSPSLTSIFSSRLLAPGERLVWEIPFEEGNLDDDRIDRIRGLKSPSLHLYAYGRIEYQSMGLIGYNQFCYKWHNLMGFSFEGDKEEFRKGGPDDYNKHT